MSKAKQTDRINSAAVQAANDYYAALAALGLPDSATPLEVNARIEKLKSDMLALALIYDEILGDERIASADDFRAAIRAVRLLRHKVETFSAQQVTTSGTYTT